MPEWLPINFDLLKNPINWLVVFFMVALPLIAVTIIHDRIFGETTGTSKA